MPPGVIHCRAAGGRTPYIYGAPAAATGAPVPLQIVAASDYAELEAEVSGKSLKHRG